MNLEERALKPCPFCGGIQGKHLRIMDRPYGPGIEDERSYTVFCGSCGAEGGWGKCEGVAISRWNLRVDDARSQWVSVEERLPPWDGIANYIQVHVYGPKIEMWDCSADGWITKQCDALFDGKDFWVNSCSFTEIVTHWMPLPDPPSGPQPGDAK